MMNTSCEIKCPDRAGHLQRPREHHRFPDHPAGLALSRPRPYALRALNTLYRGGDLPFIFSPLADVHYYHFKDEWSGIGRPAASTGASSVPRSPLEACAAPPAPPSKEFGPPPGILLPFPASCSSRTSWRASPEKMAPCVSAASTSVSAPEAAAVSARGRGVSPRVADSVL